MTPKQFIEKAIKGGWRGKYLVHGDEEMWVHEWCQATVLLDPKAWQAVGKVKGWEESGRRNFEGMNVLNKNSWLYHMHGLIDALCDEKSIEEYLITL